MTVAGDETELASFPFWAYSLRIYAESGMADAAIGLQDETGLDVNVLLFCLWSAAVGGSVFDDKQIATLRLAVAEWQREVIAPLRTLRRQLTKDGIVRQRIAAAELAAEHYEQQILSALGPATEVPTTTVQLRATAEQNLQAYLRATQTVIAGQVIVQLKVLVDAAVRLRERGSIDSTPALR